MLSEFNESNQIYIEKLLLSLIYFCYVNRIRPKSIALFDVIIIWRPPSLSELTPY